MKCRRIKHRCKGAAFWGIWINHFLDSGKPLFCDFSMKSWIVWIWSCGFCMKMLTLAQKRTFKSYNKSSLSLLIIEARNLGQCSKLLKMSCPTMCSTIVNMKCRSCDHWDCSNGCLEFAFRSLHQWTSTYILPAFHIWPDEKDTQIASSFEQRIWSL